MNIRTLSLVGFLLTVMISLPVMAAEEPKTTIVNPDTLYNPAPYGYSHAIVAEGVKRIAYIAGQGGEDSTGALEDDFGKQVKQAYKNLLSAIKATGAKPNQVTKLTTYVVNYNQSMLEIMTEELKAAFGDHLPAQTLVPVPRLALDGMLFEVDAIVVLGE